MLTFDAKEHKYHFNNVVVPSVTTIIKPLYDFRYVDPEVLGFAAERGKQVHKATEDYDLHGVEPTGLKAAFMPYFTAWKRFRETTNAEILMAEKRLYHPIHKYAGTFDRVVRINGDLYVLDIKCVAQVTKAVGVQLAAYAALLKCHLPEIGVFGEGPIKRMAVQLKATGGFVIYDCKNHFTGKNDWPTFLNLLRQYNLDLDIKNANKSVDTI